MRRITLAVVDTETGGFDPLLDALLEVSVTVLDATDPSLLKISRRSTMKVRPMSGKRISAEAAAINGYTRDKWKDALEPLEAMKVFRGVLSTEREEDLPYWVGSNPSFDFRFIEQAMKETGVEMPKLASHHLLDIGSLCWPLFLTGQVSGIKQAKLLEGLGLGTQTHTAESDVEQVLAIYQRVVPMLVAGLQK